MWKLGTFLFFILCVKVHGSDVDDTASSRLGKVLPIFQVVRFPNDVCAGATRNGTCFTAEECSSKGGTNDGSCASGFGVCCIVTLSCGKTSSENNTYLVQSATTTAPATPCNYQICPCSTDICRIRYDFTSNTLAVPAGRPQTDTDPTAAADFVKSLQQGNCMTDQMSITSPGAIGSPIICGTNSGQHMVMDSNGVECQSVNFNIGSTTTTTRSWDIFITQYTCAQEDLGGPPGCLQYFTGTTGLVKTFAYPTTNTAAATADSSIHLNNQFYQVCVRREVGYCYICYSAWHAGTDNSFGVSLDVSGNTVKANLGTQCTTDYVTIPQGMTSTIAAITTVSGVAPIGTRFCGRQLATAADQVTSGSVCSRTYPFRLGVNFDDFEDCKAAGANMCEWDTMAANMPGGIIGFALGFTQGAC